MFSEIKAMGDNVGDSGKLGDFSVFAEAKLSWG
jgi:hypothetical protein